MLKSSDLREQFIEYFVKQHGHTFVPSSPVVPLTDPTLLFTNAGMNQFKPYFLGEAQAEKTRVVNSQKCIRVSGKHNDLEEVGRDSYHHTFFEMLGNWSFGDYYKAEAIEWAWRLFTTEWGMDPSRLYATVYRDDDEAFDLWKKISGLPESRILRFGEKDNFWEMGETGPCGPCSEIHYYRGRDKVQDPGRVNADDADYIELWNLVFIQYNRDENGTLHLLPKKHVDTGAGFERIVSTLNGKNSNYESDVFYPLLDAISGISGRDYDAGAAGMAHRVIADHIRMLSFAIADGAIPGNEGRSYVLRRILRRAVRYGRQLELRDPFLYRIVPVLAEQMSGIFPEVQKQQEHIGRIIRAEEESFAQTLDRGLDIFAQLSMELIGKKAETIPGDDVFKLYDTFGFPMDLTRLLAEEKGLKIDEAGFEEQMSRQKERARAAGKFKAGSRGELTWTQVAEGESTEFRGYEQLDCEAEALAWALDGELAYLVCDRSPFYAESGGQIGDRGWIYWAEGGQTEIIDTVNIGEQRVHVMKASDFEPGRLKGTLRLKVENSLRLSTARNHSATHLLHQALKDVLGDHVKQSGSFVGPDRLRFDFNHHAKISREELREIQDRVNGRILAALPVKIHEMQYSEAVAEGAVALFGEKYADRVRTVRMGDYSFELCGGTHVTNTADIALFVIESESSIASGVRRVEAVTGSIAHERSLTALERMRELEKQLQCRAEEVKDRITELQHELQAVRKDSEELRKAQLLNNLDDLLEEIETVNDVRLLSRITEADSLDQLKEMGDRLRDRCRDCVIVLALVKDGQPQVMVAVGDDAVKKGLHAGKLVGRIGKALGGGGGGKPHMATAGGKDASLLPEVMEKLGFILEF